MTDSDGEEYAYYSDEDGYPIPDEDDNASMEWESSQDNPNAAPVMGIRIVKSEDVRPEMKRRVDEITDVLDLSPATSNVLLRAYNWSKETLLEAYMADSDTVLQKAGVYARGGHVQPPQYSPTCHICYDENSRDTMFAMPCGHAFCQECWYDFCENAVAEGPVCVNTTCPQASCREVVTEEEMTKSLGKTSPTLQKFLTYQLRNFVDSNGLTRWCPGRGCEKVAVAVSASVMEAEGCIAHCNQCVLSFCMVCGEEPHAPCYCKDLLKWNEKCRNESETANWILANTKSCPKCVSRIEKNQGCNHMTCQRCTHQFCWICMGDWNDHGANTGGYYKCNRYENNDLAVDNGDTSEAAKAKRDLDRYLHYYKRFHAHKEAQLFAKKQLKDTESRMIILQEASDDIKWTDVEFLKAATEQLVECRRVLKYTYVYAYYLDPRLSMKRERFEHHQEMLERFTENLSELSEKPLAEMDRTDVVNQTRVVDKFVKNILKYVEEGMDDV